MNRQRCGSNEDTCVRGLVDGKPHPGWCMSGHRFGRPRSIWPRLGYEGHTFHWGSSGPEHYHPRDGQRAAEWHRMAPSEAAPPGKDTWACSGCSLKVELDKDPGKYGAHAPEPMRAGPPDLFTLHVKKLFEVPPEWTVTRAEVKTGPHGAGAYELTGVVCTTTFTRGPQKGQKNWAKRDVTTERTFTITEAEHGAFVAEWEKASGLCSKCGDTGLEFESWSSTEGKKYRPCTRCVRMDDATRAQLAAKATRGPQGTRLTLSQVLELLPRRLLLKSRVDGRVRTAHEVLAGVQPMDNIAIWYLLVDEQPGPRRRLLVCVGSLGFIFTEVAPGDT